MTDPDSRAAIMPILIQAGRKWRKVAQMALAAHGISQARASALVWVHRLGGGTRQVTLASYIGIEGTSLVRLLDELSASGLVVRKDDPNDRRAKTIWLTPAGDCLAVQIEKVLATLRDRVLEQMDVADVDATLRVCHAVERAAQIMSGSGSSPLAARLFVKDVAIQTLPDGRKPALAVEGET